uniref:Uncharacterized protein n=1 Tax=Candidatus Kentrum sp. LPFa TaxID=2126335 RepID=A0A450Y341_9GAMM|nr:MAG: hypothetical protein BECKLPF1236A_GA0070988_104203 [Candidatus Kentron sp. LPFa]VFK35956.1 MAG: hypothetical protein BECKLPF1236C_GA0070990_104542 [Candidatus Kentron sp. LPFa]
MSFPTKESDILALGEKIVAGLQGNTEVYPASPLPVADLTEKLDAYLAAKNAETAAQSAWEEAVTAKRTVLRAFSDGMRTELRYAENTVHFDDAKLKLLGWGRATLEGAGAGAEPCDCAPGRGIHHPALEGSNGWRRVGL